MTGLFCNPAPDWGNGRDVALRRNSVCLIEPKTAISPLHQGHAWAKNAISWQVLPDSGCGVAALASAAWANDVFSERIGNFMPDRARQDQLRSESYQLSVASEEKTRNGILSTLSVNPPRKQRMSFRQRSVTYVKSFLRAFTRKKR
jgi:hypothetical protein